MGQDGAGAIRVRSQPALLCTLRACTHACVAFLCCVHPPRARSAHAHVPRVADSTRTHPRTRRYWSWLSNAYYHVVIGALQGQPPFSCLARLAANLWPTMLAQWALWVPVQLLNFWLVPVRHQLNFVLAVSLVWTTFLSLAFPPDAVAAAPVHTKLAARQHLHGGGQLAHASHDRAASTIARARNMTRLGARALRHRKMRIV